MAAKQRAYTKLTGKRLFFFVRCSLWQAADHLLWVQGNLMQEHYKRFYYKDIQAVILCRNRRRLLWSIVWGALLGLSGLSGLAISSGGAGFVVLSAVWALLLAINLLCGPSCDVYLQTAVQLEKLTSLGRVRTAAKALDRIRTAAEQAQGALQGHLFAAAAGVLLPNDRQIAPGSAAAARQNDAGDPHWGLLHRALVAVLLSLGVLEVVQLHFKWLWAAALELIALAGLLGLAITVLVRRSPATKGSWLAAVGWPALFLALLRGAAAYAFFVATTLRHPDMAYNGAMMMTLFLELAMTDHPLITALSGGFAAIAIIMGLSGAAAFWRERRFEPETIQR